MALTDLQVFSRYAYSAMTEVLDQQIDLFNQATRGGIILRSQSNQGDYNDEAFWKRVSGLVRRRNAYGSGAVSEKVLEHLLKTSVKVAAGTPPVRIDPGMLRWIQRSPQEAGAVIGQQMAGDTMADMLNTAIMGYVAAVGQVSAVVHDYSGSGTLSLAQLNTGASKFGDAAQDISVWVMHSKSLFDLYGEALTNTNRLFQFGTVRVIEDGFGRPLIMTDSPQLVDTVPVPDVYFTLGLTSNAVIVDRNNDFDDNIESSNGDENIIRTYQAEWSYNLGLKGFAWDKTNGGASPNDAALGTATNWDRYATSDKDLAGVLVKTQ